MTTPDPSSLTKSILGLWDRGSLILWALALAAVIALGFASAFAIFAPEFGTLQWTPWCGLAFIIFACLAGAKTYQERTVKTLHFIPDDQQSFWHHAQQPDGRELTQIALRGRVTNLWDRPLYPAAVRLVSPRGSRAIHRLIFTEEHDGRFYGSDYPIPPGERVGFSAHFFADGFIGTPGKPLSITISVSDQFGHWHNVKIPDLTRPEDKGK